MNKLKLRRCEICGNIIMMINDEGPVPECCGLPMVEVAANEEDAAIEKHLPVIMQKGTNVLIHVGETAHPMTNEHYIMWVILMTNRGAYARELHPGEPTEVALSIGTDEEVEGAYAFCNIHGLWFKNLRHN